MGSCFKFKDSHAEGRWHFPTKNFHYKSHLQKMRKIRILSHFYKTFSILRIKYFHFHTFIFIICIFRPKNQLYYNIVSNKKLTRANNLSEVVNISINDGFGLEDVNFLEMKFSELLCFQKLFLSVVKCPFSFRFLSFKFFTLRLVVE